MNINAWNDSPELRTSIGLAAKKTGWFKDTTRGDLWFKSISPTFQNSAFGSTNLALELGKIWEWVEHV